MTTKNKNRSQNPAQRIASKRNFNKMRVAGALVALSSVYDQSPNEYECKCLGIAMDALMDTLEKWDDR